MARQNGNSGDMGENYNPYHELLDDPEEMNAREQDDEVRQGMSIENDVVLSNRTGKHYRVRSVHSKNAQARRDYLGY